MDETKDEQNAYTRDRHRLVDTLVAEGVLRTPTVIAAMNRVPRELFVPEALRSQAYSDNPLPTDHGQTISAPHMVAIMNEALELEAGQRVLEVGAGSGYHAATISEIIGPEGRVYAIERVEALVRLAKDNLAAAGYSDRVIIAYGDGSVGYLDRAPYDRILVTAAAPKVPPALIAQLGPLGVLVVPVGGRLFSQELVRIRKVDDRVTRQSLGGVAFVPLVGEQGHHS